MSVGTERYGLLDPSFLRVAVDLRRSVQPHPRQTEKPEVEVTRLAVEFRSNLHAFRPNIAIGVLALGHSADRQTQSPIGYAYAQSVFLKTAGYVNRHVKMGGFCIVEEYRKPEYVVPLRLTEALLEGIPDEERLVGVDEFALPLLTRAVADPQLEGQIAPPAELPATVGQLRHAVGLAYASNA